MYLREVMPKATSPEWPNELSGVWVHTGLPAFETVENKDNSVDSSNGLKGEQCTKYTHL